MLYLKVRGGLCNRLRAIASAVGLAKDCKDKLCVVWGYDLGMDESFSAAMLRPAMQSFTIIQEGDEGFDEISCRFSPKSRNYYRQMNGKEALQREAQVNSILSKQQDDDSYIETCYQFYKKTDYSWLRPNPKLLKIIDAVQRRIGGSYIGIHIRRTDNIKSWVYSPLHLFEKAIRQETEKNDNARFFLATDDISVKSHLTALFGTRIFTRQDIAARYSKGGLADALVDFILLSKSEKLYGSYWSSFSDVAAEVSGIPFVCVQETDPTNIIQNYHERLTKVEQENSVLSENLANYPKSDDENTVAQLSALRDKINALQRKNRALEDDKERARHQELTIIALKKQIHELQREVHALKTSEVYRTGMFITWPARKAWGGVKSLREKGFKYTAKHFVGKIARHIGLKDVKW